MEEMDTVRGNYNSEREGRAKAQEEIEEVCGIEEECKRGM